MPSRAIQSFQYQAIQSRLRENLVRLQSTQLDIASGRRVRSAADDPSGTGRLLGLDRRRSTLERWSTNSDRVYATLSQSADEIQEAASILAEVRERIIEGLNGTLTGADRGSLASEIDRSVDQLLLAANAGTDGRYFFAGSAVSQAPFARRPSADGIERVPYLGDDLEPRVELATGVTEKTGLAGGRVFGPSTQARGDTTYSGGGTGARSAAGLVDSARGRGSLIVAHVQTSFGAPGSNVATHAASGVALATGSASGDTILGAGHTLALVVGAGGDGTASLNGGDPVAFSAGDADVEVTGPGGERVRIDASGAIAGYSGTATLGATGSLSSDGGQNTIAIDFAATSVTLKTGDGRTSFVDPRNIRKAGTERTVYTGTVDPFDALLAVRDLFRLNGNAAETAVALADVREYLGEIDRSRDRLLSALADIAGGAARAEATQSRIEDAKVRLDGDRSKIRDVDLAEATTRLASQDDAYQASLLIAARVNQTSLLDFLR